MEFKLYKKKLLSHYPETKNHNKPNQIPQKSFTDSNQTHEKQKGKPSLINNDIRA
jgi:hypothetical protein